MKKSRFLLLLIVLSLILPACGQGTAGQSTSGQASSAEQLTWQEQYDLGVRYLSEGNYEEAIIAFTAAIEIDPKRAPAYVGRGDAYVLSGETEENLTAAQADYEKAIELDEMLAEAYLGLADVYIRQGEYEKALEILKQGLEKCKSNQEIFEKIQQFNGGTIVDKNGNTRKSIHFENGELIEYWLYEYDETGNNIKITNYNADEEMTDVETFEFNELRQKIRMTRVYKKGDTRIETYEYDGMGRLVRIDYVDIIKGSESDGGYSLIFYDDNARTESTEQYSEEGKLTNKFVVEKNENGVRKKGFSYKLNEKDELYLDYYVEYIWNSDGTYGGYNLVRVAEKQE
ncbi:tetratricopeptide repeat protein [Oscillospiraceae bacterium 50-58]